MKRKHETLLYIFLFAVLGFGAEVFLLYRYNPNFQFLTVLISAVFYLVWGAYFHHLKRDLGLKLFLEYLAIASIAVVSSFFVLYF